MLASLAPSPQFLEDGVSQKTLDRLENAEGVFLLENIRFHEEETKFDEFSEFSQMYQKLGDVLVADCFGCVHRKHTSIVHLAGDDSKQFGYGFLIEEECDALGKLLDNQGKSVLGIMGGAKIKDKQPMIECLSKVREGLTAGDSHTS